ncbi:MAG: OmpA family protein [Proteobacteria bacterium]|nr:OmpA family protein [Pseudomonadota bacterium]
MRTMSLGAFLTVETVLLLVLAGCGAAFDYEGLRRMEAPGDGFTARLAREYKDFALFEADEMYDWPDAAHFGEKALAAAQGEAPAPEPIGAWRLPADLVDEMTRARRRLISALDAGARQAAPGAAARGQARFDCWLEQQEENWQADHIKRCRDGTFAALEKMEKAVAAWNPGGHPALRPAVLPGDGSRPKAFLVFFTFDGDSLLADGMAAMDAVAEAAKSGVPVSIGVGGHADRAGPDRYNMDLSLRRAETVSRALAERGVDRALITVSAHGESHPRIATPDGVREPRNRRVEVTISPAPAL